MRIREKEIQGGVRQLRAETGHEGQKLEDRKCSFSFSLFNKCLRIYYSRELFLLLRRKRKLKQQKSEKMSPSRDHVYIYIYIPFFRLK